MPLTFTPQQLNALGSRFAEVLSYLNQLRDQGFATDPTLEDEGQQKVYSEDGRIKGRIFFNSDEVQLLLTHFLEEDLDCNLNELLNARLENLGTFITPDTGTPGQVGYHSGLEQLQYATDAVVRLLPYCEPGVTEKLIALKESDLVMDGTGDTVTIRGRVPAGFAPSSDAKVLVSFSVNQGESNGDDADFEALWRSISQAEDRNKAQSTSDPSLTDLGSSIVEDNLYEAEITLPFDDGTNPIVAGDWLEVTVKRVDLAEVGAITLFAVALKVPVYNYADDEAA